MASLVNSVSEAGAPRRAGMGSALQLCHLGESKQCLLIEKTWRVTDHQRR